MSKQKIEKIDPTDDREVPVKDAAELIGFTRVGIQYHINTGKLPTRPFGGGSKHPALRMIRVGDLARIQNLRPGRPAGVIPAENGCTQEKMDGKPCSNTAMKGKKICRVHQRFAQIAKDRAKAAKKEAAKKPAKRSTRKKAAQ